jgi:hypothetical protein
VTEEEDDRAPFDLDRTTTYRFGFLN